jgi:hypothetical protein
MLHLPLDHCRHSQWGPAYVSALTGVCTRARTTTCHTRPGVREEVLPKVAKVRGYLICESEVQLNPRAVRCRYKISSVQPIEQIHQARLNLIDNT